MPEETPVPVPTGELAPASPANTNSGGLRVIPAPTGELGSISGSSGHLGAISTVPIGELATKTVYSTNTFGFQDVKEALPPSQQLQLQLQQKEPVQETLFRHQVFLATKFFRLQACPIPCKQIVYWGPIL